MTGRLDSLPDSIDENVIVRDGHRNCCCGAYVRVAKEYEDWEVFKKFFGKIGRLTWRHFSGMWFAEFPGQAEYAFLCGPLLHQLQYATAADAKAYQLQQQEDMRKRMDQEQKAAAVTALQKQMEEKRQAELAESTMRMFEHMNLIQEGLIQSRMDTQAMMEAFSNVSDSAFRLDEELKVTSQELEKTKADLESTLEKLDNSDRVGTALRDSLESAQENITALQTNLSDLLALRTRDAEILSSKEKEILHLEECKKILETEQKRLVETIYQLQDEKLKLSKKEAATQLELDKAKKEMAKTTQALELKRGDCLAMEKELKAAKNNVLELNKRLIQEAEKFQNTVKLLEAQNRDLENQNKEFEALFLDDGNVAPHAQQPSAVSSVGEPLPSQSKHVEELRPSRAPVNNLQRFTERPDLSLSVDKVANTSIVINLKKQLASAEEKASQLEVEVESLRIVAKQHEQAVVEVTRLTEKEADLTAENEKLQASITKNAKYHAEATKKMKDELHALNRQIENLTETESRQKERINILSAQSAQKDSERLSLISEAQRQKEALSEALNRCNTLSDERDNAQATIRSLQSQLEEQRNLAAENKQAAIKFKSENGRITQELAVTRQREEGLISQRSEMTEAVQQSKKKITLLEKDSATLRERLEKAESKASELQEKVAYIPVLQKLYESNQHESIKEIQTLQSQLKTANKEIQELAKSVSDLTLDKFQTEAANSNLKKQVSTVLRPYRVCFVLWHFIAIIEKHENNIKDNSALHHKAWVAQQNVSSLRMRLKASYRLVEELQKRDRENNVCSEEKSTGTSIDVHCAPNASLVLSEENAMVPVKSTRTELKEIDDDKTMEKIALLKQEIAGLRQRNTRLQSELKTAEEEARKSNGQLAAAKSELGELQKQFSTMDGCLKAAYKVLPNLRERKSLYEAKGLLKSLSLNLMEHERSVLSGKSALNTTNISPIVSRRIELEEEAIKKREAEESVKPASPGFIPSLSIAEVEENLEASLQILQTQVASLQDRLDHGDSKRHAKLVSVSGKIQSGLPLISSLSSIDKGISAGNTSSDIVGSMSIRPHSAMGLVQPAKQTQSSSSLQKK